MKLNTLTLTETIKKLKAKEISHAELYRDIHEAIAEKNEKLNVYLTLDNEALAKAEKKLDTPLAGAPIAVKDNYLTAGMRTTASSNVLKDFIPPFDATVIHRLKKSGGVVLGKTNMDAWAHGSSTETSDFGPTKNPRNPQYLPGGSSGGSAAAVAADMCVAALGTETAGSIRQPSAWCGVVGLKPTYGRVSRAGIVAMASSTDSPGPIGKTVEDCAVLLTHIAGPEPYDATTSPQPVPDFTKILKNGVKDLRIGICYTDHPQLKGSDAAKAVEEAGRVFERLGAKVEKAVHLFITKTGKPLLVRNIRSTINRYFKLAGVEKAKVNDLRHTFVAHHLASGVNIITVSKVAGHKRLSTTERYLQYIEKTTTEEKNELGVL